MAGGWRPVAVDYWRLPFGFCLLIACSCARGCRPRGIEPDADSKSVRLTIRPQRSNQIVLPGSNSCACTSPCPVCFVWPHSCPPPLSDCVSSILWSQFCVPLWYCVFSFAPLVVSLVPCALFLYFNACAPSTLLFSYSRLPNPELILFLFSDFHCPNSWGMCDDDKSAYSPPRG